MARIYPEPLRPNEVISGCYLLHFERKFHHAQHYLGYSQDIYWRVYEHQHGVGSRLTVAVYLEGINMHLVRIWPKTTRRFERRLKQLKKIRTRCPVCRLAALGFVEDFNGD